MKKQQFFTGENKQNTGTGKYICLLRTSPRLRRYIRTVNVIEVFMRQVRGGGRDVLTSTEYRTEVLVCFVASEYNRRARKIKDVALFDQWISERSQNRH